MPAIHLGISGCARAAGRCRQLRTASRRNGARFYVALGWVAVAGARYGRGWPLGPRGRVTSAGALSIGGAVSRGCCSNQRA